MPDELEHFRSKSKPDKFYEMGITITRVPLVPMRCGYLNNIGKPHMLIVANEGRGMYRYASTNPLSVHIFVES